MSPERRKAMIVAAALPLVAEYGTAVTTSQIAKAAGIGEATIFRVFADKEELLDACMNEALRPDHAVEQIASIPLDQPLADRLAEAIDALGAHLERIGTIANALMAGGHRGRRDGRAPGGGRDEVDVVLGPPPQRPGFAEGALAARLPRRPPRHPDERETVQQPAAFQIERAAQVEVEPVYETIPGWQANTRGARSWADLPAPAIKYIRRVEELIGAPVALLSTSPEREDTILVADPFAD